MALSEKLPLSPHEISLPEHRWVPGDEALGDFYANLLPPLLAKIRKEVTQWRASNYQGASETSKALLNWWFETEHLIEGPDGTLSSFRYYFAQREAVESVIWLYEVKAARDKFDLMRFDSSQDITLGMFDEEWTRYVIKMATGSGKTKVLSLLIAWSYFHKTYEQASDLSRNFLLIAPNIIVLDRLRSDFDGLKIFFNDPVIPDNGISGKAWKDDFQITLHLQDDVRALRKTGNIFLSNIHRVYIGSNGDPTLDDEDLADYFLGPFGDKPSGKTTDSQADLGEIVRELDELAIFNDEAHHIHDARLAWFKSIQDIHHKMLQKDRKLSLQLDVTATPKHNNGAIFVQTVCDYPLVEAIYQNVVKHPVLPDSASRSRLHEQKSAIFSERYGDYLDLGIEEWKKVYPDHARQGRKAILFVMVDDTKNCDEVGEYLEKQCPELQDSVLVIHTKNNGEISEAASGKNKEELEKLRAAANSIDSWESPYKAVVSVLMLKEGWDVRNVTTIVGLRAYSSKANILPEQTLGRGLRRMYPASNEPEYVSVLGTDAFMDFVEQIQAEGVIFEYRPMGGGGGGKDSIVVEVDEENQDKDLDSLDIAIPKLTRRFNRDYKDLNQLDPSAISHKKIPLKPFNLDEVREIVFKRMLDNEHDHTIILDNSGPVDFRSVVGFFARQLMRELHLVGGYDVLYGHMKSFLSNHLFDSSPVNLEDPVVMRNLAEPGIGKIVFDSFKSAINDLTIQESGTTTIEARIQLRHTRPFRTNRRSFLPSDKSVFNFIVGEAGHDKFEIEFAAFLENAPDVQAYAKNYFAVGFRMDYVKENGDLSHYTPDFIARDQHGKIWIIETKGRREIDLPQKMSRLSQWCRDASEASEEEEYDFIFVDQESFQKSRPSDFHDLATSFQEFKS